MTEIVLASSSPYRRALLERLGLPFRVERPAVDETPLPGERAEDLVARLARAKAEAVARRLARGLCIGSDQVAVVDGRVLGKPGGHEANVRQLRAVSGRRVGFLTGLCLVDAQSGAARCETVPYHVVFRELNEREIEAYVSREAAFDCAGGFRCEGLGIALFERMEGDDPTALVGLPLIRLTAMLGAAGVDVLAP